MKEKLLGLAKTATSVSDTLPANVAYVPRSIVTDPNCGSATTLEEDNATGADESDPYRASFFRNYANGHSGLVGAFGWLCDFLYCDD